MKIFLLLLILKKGLGLRCFTCGIIPRQGHHHLPEAGCQFFNFQIDQAECKPGEVCISFTSTNNRGSEPSRGCFPVNETLYGARVGPASSCSQVRLSADAAVRYCTCDTDLCNVNLYNFSEFTLLSMEETRQGVKRHRVDVPDSFKFPFQERSNSEISIFRGEGEPGVRCHDCGSLFSHESPHCPEFDARNSTQQRRCAPGQVCLLYQWSQPRHGAGSYRECFSSNIILGHPEDPIIPQPRCKLAKTQRDPTSSTQACLCTTDLCNLENDLENDNRGPLQVQRHPKLSPLRPREESVICPIISIYNADYAECNGEYRLTDFVVLWAVERPVYRHVDRDRFIFWNKGGLGWSIGKKAYLTSGSHWHRSGLDSAEPWQGAWEGGVAVECVTRERAQDCLWSGYSAWSSCSATCGSGTQVRSRQVLERAHSGGRECQGEAEQFRRCEGVEPCLDLSGGGGRASILCLWSSWGSWSPCSASCARGTQRRFRVFLIGQGGREGRSLDEDKCDGDAEETRECQASQCSDISQDVCCDTLTVVGDAVSGLFTRHQDSRVYIRHPDTSTDPSYSPRYLQHHQDYGWVLSSSPVNNNLTSPNVSLIHPCPESVARINVLGPEDFLVQPGVSVGCANASDHQIIQQPATTKKPGVTHDERELKTSGHAALEDDEVITESKENNNIYIGNILSTTKEKQLAPPPPDDDNVSTINQTSLSKLTSILAEDNIKNDAPAEHLDVSTSTASTSTTSSTTSNSSTKSKIIVERRGVQCFSCGSLYSSTSPDCDVFNKTDEAQQVTCPLGEACLFYAWKASNTKTAIIRECFSRSILLGSQEDPVQITESCEPRSVDSEGSIWACICTSDLCNGLPDYQLTPPDTDDSDTALWDPPQNQKEVVDKAVKIGTNTATAFVSTAKPKFNKIICHQCGSLFSGKNSDCSVFDPNNRTQEGFCEAGEACLWYSWQKTKECHKPDS